MRRRYFISLFVASFIFVGMTSPQSQKQLPTVNIGIIIDGYGREGIEEYLDLFTREILELTRAEYDVRFPMEKLVMAEWTKESVQFELEKLLADPEIDIIIAFGLIVSNVVTERGNLPKPVIAPFVMDAKLFGFPFKDGASGIKNFNYISIPDRFYRDVNYFLQVVKFRKLAYLFNQHYLTALPEIIARSREIVKDLGVDLQVIGVDTSIDEAFSKLPPDTEAVFVGPLTNVPIKELEKLPDKLITRKLPSFSDPGAINVQKGILISIMSEFLPQVARRIGLNVQRILMGEEPGSIPVYISPIEHPTINMATARAIGVYPVWSVLNEAELLYPEIEEAERRLSLRGTIQEAITVNLDLAARAKFVSAGRQNVKEAIAQVLPRLDLSGTGLIIDKDRAEASFGSQAQRSISGSISATQVLFSEQTFANISIQKSLQKGREWEYEQLKLDIALAASMAYLNLLHAKTFERIQRENLKKIRTNLEIARIRDSVGAADPAEVFRWESEMATNRKSLLQAEAQRTLAEIEVNRLLNRPLGEPFITVELDLADSMLDMTEEEFMKYMDNAQRFFVFRNFMVEEGLNASPEMAILNQAIEAQERLYRSVMNSYWAPTLAFQGEFSTIFSKGGAGAESDPVIQQMMLLPDQNDSNWTFVLSLNFPLFKGGEKAAVKTKSLEELENLRLQQEATSQRIEQRIMSSIHLAASSYSSVEQAQKAAEAAQKSFFVVQEAYSEGVVTLVYLLDAQNAALMADLSVASAIYSYLIDMLNVERAIGEIDLFLNRENREAFIKRVDAYFRKEGIIVK